MWCTSTHGPGVSRWDGVQPTRPPPRQADDGPPNPRVTADYREGMDRLSVRPCRLGSPPPVTNVRRRAGGGMSWQESLGVAVASGVLVPAILGLARLAWNRRRVPTALTRSVPRASYLRVVLAESQRPGTTQLEVLGPRLMPARTGRLIRQIQGSWAAIVPQGTVRVIILDSEECIEAGAELSVMGVEVRVARRELGSESLSYHLFGTGEGVTSTAIINHHQGGHDRPELVHGTVPTEPYRAHFCDVWQSASPLESV